MNLTRELTDGEIPELVGQLIRERRTIHVFQTKSVPERLLMDSIDAACWAPNHHLTEPWSFHLLGPRTIERVVALNTELVRAKKGDAAAAAKQARWSEIPGWLAVTSKRCEDPQVEWEDYAATCCAVQNLALALWSHGVGMKWTTGPVTRHEDFYRLLQIDPDSQRIVGLMWYGYAAAIPDQKPRAVTDHVIRHA